MNRQLPIILVPGLDEIIDTDRITLSLEQEETGVDDINLRDVYNMWLLARDGYSARTYKPYDCKVKFDETTITFSIGFYVWPVPIGTPYSLSANQGIIDEGVRFQRSTEKSITFPLSNIVTLDRSVSNIGYYWETPNIDRYGVTHSAQEISLVRDSLVTPDPYFGVARVSFLEEGFRHEVELTLVNVDEEGNNIQIGEIDITITAIWQDEEDELQETVLKLAIPKCVEQALRICKAKPNMVCQSCDAYEVRVYYNVCGDDEVLEVRRVELLEDGGSWCLPQE